MTVASLIEFRLNVILVTLLVLVPFRFNKTSLPCLANELLDEITRYLPRRDQHALLCTGWALHDVVSRQLYRDVSVYDSSAKRFFKTIIESTESYGTYTKELQYTVSTNNDVSITHALLRRAVPFLANVESLTMIMRTQLSPFLKYMLRYSVHPIQSTYADAIRLDDKRLRVVDSPITFCNFPKLKKFNLHGDIKVIRFISIKSVLVKICLTEAMDDDSFTFFLNEMAPTGTPNTSLSILCITLQFVESYSRIGTSLYRLGNAFPNIKSLTVRSPKLDALEASLMLTLDPPLFREARLLQFNDWTITTPVIIPVGSGPDHLKVQGIHITKAAESRRNLVSVNFGMIKWAKSVYSGGWEQTNKICVDSGDDDELYPDFDKDSSLFWDVLYINPEPLHEPLTKCFFATVF
ncbi:hypothetical protein JR316_0001696 [Psilocybe cubensis]|uniref:Uncharacterized protein n=1 Tax=Psilocybe cubensis TaxID=181762 RepID=A0ACB8HAE2_PSICU|nr:hypothetical protein JR316_0001696 [Psilocybe cubensis]KAH9484794.1 hypothetical protein JR316_0001696 [Psilocybe cubensis]